MTNVLILKGKIVERGITQEVVADEMGINRTTFYRKMKEEGRQFTVEEIHKIIKILKLSNDDVMNIFFTAQLA